MKPEEDLIRARPDEFETREPAFPLRLLDFTGQAKREAAGKPEFKTSRMRLTTPDERRDSVVDLLLASTLQFKVGYRKDG